MRKIISYLVGLLFGKCIFFRRKEIATLAHDLCNVLMVISGKIDSAQKKIAPDSHAQKMLEDAQDGVVMGAELLKRFAAGNKSGNRAGKKCNTNSALEKSVKILSGSPGVSHEVRINGKPWDVRMDPSDFCRVMCNLLLNAAQSGPVDGKILVEVENMPPKRSGIFGSRKPHVVIRISDRGSGISKENLDKVFRPGFTTKKDGKGMGLASVHNLVAGYGGRVEIESVPEKGSIFSVILPALP